MTDTSSILDKIRKDSYFARSDLQFVMEECGYQTSESITNHLLMYLLATGDVVRIGRNRYCVTDFLKTYRFPYSELAISTADEIKNAHPYLNFRLFELVQLNEFVNHQIAHNILFVSAEGPLEEDVFNTLWEKHKGSILLKPKAEELFRYMNEDMVVITKLPTESPKGSVEFWDTRLEKMLVDIAVDKLLRKVINPGEYPAIFREAFRKYAIDRNAMARYARRRGSLKKFQDFLVNEAELRQEECGI